MIISLPLGKRLRLGRSIALVRASAGLMFAPRERHASCLSPVRPFFGAHGKWTEAAPAALDQYYHSVVDYEPDMCRMLERVRNRHGRKPAKYLHRNARFDAERNSRLVWTDASGVPQRRFDTGAFLSRFRGSDVVIVGDSHSGIVHQSLSILLGCTQPQREWPEVPGYQSSVVGRVGTQRNRTRRDYGVLSLAVPEYDFRLFRIPTNILTPVVETKRSTAAPSFYIQNGQRIPMRAQATDKIVRLDAPGLGTWADASQFRRASLVVMKQGEWAKNYRSDVKVFTKRGDELKPGDGDAALKEMFETGVQRTIDWFDKVLPPTAVVIWMAGGASILGQSCSAVGKDKPCRGSGRSRDGVLIKALETRRQRWAGCGAEACARSRPRQWLLDISAPQICRPDLQMGCKGLFENGTVRDWHPAIPGMPDLWNAMAFESVLEDDVRCAARTQLTPTAGSGAYLASLDREDRKDGDKSGGLVGGILALASAIAKKFVSKQSEGDNR